MKLFRQNAEVISPTLAYFAAGVCFMQMLLAASEAADAIAASLLVLMASRVGRLVANGFLSIKSVGLSSLNSLTFACSLFALVMFELHVSSLHEFQIIAAGAFAGLAQAFSIVFSRTLASNSKKPETINLNSNFGWAVGTLMPVLNSTIFNNGLGLAVIVCAAALLSASVSREQNLNGLAFEKQCALQNPSASPSNLAAGQFIVFAGAGACLITIVNANMLNILKNQAKASSLQLALALLAIAALSFILLLKPVKRALANVRDVKLMGISRVLFAASFVVALHNAQTLWASIGLIAMVNTISLVDLTARVRFAGSRFPRSQIEKLHSRGELVGIAMGFFVLLANSYKIASNVQVAFLLFVSLILWVSISVSVSINDVHRAR